MGFVLTAVGCMRKVNIYSHVKLPQLVVPFAEDLLINPIDYSCPNSDEVVAQISCKLHCRLSVNSSSCLLSKVFDNFNVNVE
jgi:hypothetical protein